VVSGVRGNCASLSFLFVVFGFGVDFGGGGRVRTRNTLHIVGARKSSICYNAVEGRKMKRKKRREKEKRENNVINENVIK